MQFEHIRVSFTVEQASRLRQTAERQGRTVDEIVRDAVDAIEDISIWRFMNAPVDDWDVMKRQIEDSRYPELEGWRPDGD